jgi:hypothetical protein
LTSSTLSIRQARRAVLAAQGLVPSLRGLARPDRRHVDKVLDKIGLIQIDSVNALERSHYLPLFSRLGPYSKQLLDGAAYCAQPKRRLFEYWGHEASLLPVALEPLMRWRMKRAAQGRGVYKEIVKFGEENAPRVEELYAQIRDRGPSGVSDLSGDEKRQGPWWGWHDTKIALEWMFWTGRITTQGRRNFERIYDLPDRVIPQSVRSVATPREDDAQRELVRIAARALGVATQSDLRDYFRMEVEDTKARVLELVEAGDLIPVEVEGWQKPAFLSADAKIPARATACALLSPFDSLVWERARTERLFGFRYRLEIYVPAPKREYGYYVLPFLCGDKLVARVDLKADRKEGVLRILAAYAEPGIERGRVASALAGELVSLANWLGLSEVRSRRAGDFAAELEGELALAVG